MKVFISWSGSLSQQIGEALKDWLPAVLQSIKPYFTPSDIEKGSRWTTDIGKELEMSKVGIFIFTKDNLDSQWMLFEAGAISKTIENSRVCPILFGVDNSDFKGPLTQFQTSTFNKPDIKQLLKTVNSALQDQKLEDKVLDEVFEMWWPKLEQRINRILDQKKVENTSIRSDREILEELLEISRINAKNLSARNKGKHIGNYNPDELERLVRELINSAILTFSWDWDHTRNLINDDLYISPDGDFLNPMVQDEYSNWSNRGTFLNAYRNLKAFTERYGIGDFDDPF